ncbi:MAG: hypothetical protein AAGK02_10090 [Pseudomonadota bacterium]
MIDPKAASTLAISLLLITACGDSPPSVEVGLDPQDTFFAELSKHCGKAYSGSVAVDDEMDEGFANAELVMHVRECSEDRIAIPFHVQRFDKWDRSRTWVITRTDAGLRLKHDHRHEDGTSDTITMYGGDTASAGTGQAQRFPVDQESIDLFEREGLCASVINTWMVAVDPMVGREPRFTYELTRPYIATTPNDSAEYQACPGRYTGRTFRVEFDLTREVEAPPAPWGHE